MKKQIQNILLIIGVFAVGASCDDDFLTKKHDVVTLEAGIYVSPEWGAEIYPVAWANAGNAKYTITDAPEWLKLEFKTGVFLNGVAYIVCEAIQQTDFSQSGIYNAYMKIEVEGVGACMLPVGYVNEGEPMIECNPESIIFDATGYYRENSFVIRNSGNGILIWQVLEMPNWITLSNHEGILHQYNNTNYILVNLKSDQQFANDITGKILIGNNSRNDQIYAIDVQYKAVPPSFVYWDGPIHFEHSTDPKTITIWNQSSGTLNWIIDQCPDWITVSKQQGTLIGYENEKISLTCNRVELALGNHTGTLKLLTNDPNIPFCSIEVTCWSGEGSPEYITAVSGNVIDVEIDKSSETLYLITQNPNQLIAYQFATKSITKTLDLDQAPTFISITDDGKRAITGHNGYVNYIDLPDLTLLKTLTTDFLAHDGIVVNENWCLVSSQQRAFWLDITTNAISSFINEGYPMIFKKIHGKDIIFGKRINVFPGGVYYIDTQTRTLRRYFHTDILPIWTSQDGERIINGWSRIYRTSAIILSTENSPSPFAYLQNRGNYYGEWVGWVDHSPETNSLWVLEKPSGSNVPWILSQYEDKNYRFVASYNYSDFYTTVNEVANLYQTSARYVFVNRNGTEVYLVKKMLQHNVWSVECIQVN